MGVKFDKLKK